MRAFVRTASKKDAVDFGLASALLLLLLLFVLLAEGEVASCFFPVSSRLLLLLLLLFDASAKQAWLLVPRARSPRKALLLPLLLTALAAEPTNGSSTRLHAMARARVKRRRERERERERERSERMARSQLGTIR